MALQDVMRVDNGKVIRGGGTSDYADLSNKPSINGVTLSGNKTTSDLGINADNVMMSDSVTSVEEAVDGLTANTLGTAVSIPAATDYIATNDGYVKGVCAAGASRQLTITVNAEQMARAISTADFPAIASVFVRKGMIVKWTATDQTNSTAYFYQLT